MSRLPTVTDTMEKSLNCTPSPAVKRWAELVGAVRFLRSNKDRESEENATL